MSNAHHRIFICLTIFFMLAPIHAKTLRIDEAQSVMPVLVDIPDNWIKNQILKDNGIIYTLRLENAEIEIRSFIFNGVDMDYIIHAKAARMYAKYSYINILLEKEETLGDVKKQTIFWKIRHQNKTYYEKTVILQYINNIVILSCLAPEDEYPHHRVIFENAILSIKYDIENGEATTVSDKDKKKEGSTEKKEITKEILRDIEEKYSRENKINKMDKLKKENEEK